MKRYISFIFLFAFASSYIGFCQCAVSVPSSVQIVRSALTISGGSNVKYVCNGGSVLSSSTGLGGGNKIYMDSGSYFLYINNGSGSNTIYVKNYATIDISGTGGGGGNVLYYEPHAIIHGTHPGLTLILCNPITYDILLSGSFAVLIKKLCTGPQITIKTDSYLPTYKVVTLYGDGQSDTSMFSSVLGGGAAIDTHLYQSSGNYSVKHILFNGASRVDSMRYSYEYGFCRTLPIKFYYDADSNCVKDNTDTYIMYPLMAEVDSNSIPIDTISTTSGFYYNANGSPGDIYSFRLLSIPPGLHPVCPLSGIIFDTLPSSIYSPVTKYIGFIGDTTTGFDLQQYSTVRYGRHASSANVSISNPFCTPQSGTVMINKNPKYDFVSAVPAPTSIIGNTIIWNFAGAAVFNPPLRISASFSHSGTFLPPGDTVLTAFSVSPTDYMPHNNSCVLVDTVKTSFDPNYVSVSPNGCIETGVSQLQYTIHFENMGNDTAFNIFIMDTLSDNLNVHSFEVLTSSAVMNISKTRSSGHNIIRFDFPNINLLDSSHHNECDGFVMFKIKTKNLSSGATILNRAGIYFDTNPVIMTNAVENIVSCATLNQQNITSGCIEIYPNPTSNQLSVKTDNDTYTSLSITNTMGQQIMQQQFSASQSNVDVKMLPPGLYYIMLRGEQGSVVKKFVKM